MAGRAAWVATMLAAALVAPGAAVGQEESRVPAAGDYGISFGLPDGRGASFPAIDVSVSGSTGLQLAYAYRESDQNVSSRSFGVGTTRSELSLNVYF